VSANSFCSKHFRCLVRLCAHVEAWNHINITVLKI